VRPLASALALIVLVASAGTACTSAKAPSDAAVTTPTPSRSTAQADPEDERPPAEARTILLFADAPGLGPTEVEALITAPIEDALRDLHELTRVESESRSGSSSIELTLDRSVDVYAARQAVAARLSQLQPTLPADVEVVLTANRAPAAQSIAFIVRPGDSTPAAQAMIVGRLRQALLETPGVSHLELCGERSQQLLVAAAPARLKSLALSIDDLRLALTQSVAGNIVDSRPGGHLAGGVRLRAKGDVIEEIENIVVSTSTAGGSKAPIMLRDVASISLSYATPACDAAELGGAAALLGVVWPSGDTDLSKLDAEVRRRLGELGDNMPAQGPSLEVIPHASTTILIELRALRDPAQTVAETAAKLTATLGPETQGILRAPTPRADGAFVDAELRLTTPALTPDTLRTIEEKLAAIPQLRVRDVQAPGSQRPLRVRVVDPDLERAGDIAEQVATAATSVPGVLSAHARIRRVPELEIEIERDSLARFGIRVADFNRSVAFVLRAVEVARITADEQDLPVLLRLGDPARAPLRPEELTSVHIPLRDGASVPLRQIAQIHMVSAPQALHRVDGQRSIDVELRLSDPDARAPLMQHISSAIDLPKGTQIIWE